MLTFKPEVMRNEQKVDGTFNVKVRITYQRKVKRLPTSIFVEEKDLTGAFKLKNQRIINEVDDLIRSYQEICASLQVELHNYTLDEIVAYLKEERERPKSVDFIQFCNEWLETTTIKGKKNYKSALHAFVDQLGTDKLNTDQVTSRLQVNVPSFLQPLMEKYKDGLGKHIFRFYRMYSTADNFNKAINFGLKEVGKSLKIDDLEFYAARHSWATIALNKVGIDKYTVHAALNHIDESMKVTDIYIERDFVNGNIANAKVVKYVFG